MNKIFTILSILSWILCFSYEILFILKNSQNKEANIIRLDKLFLIIIFIIYLRFNKDFITSIVFTVICLYMYINKLYEKTTKEKFLIVLKNNWLIICNVVFISLIPLIYYFITKRINDVYIILLFYIFLSRFIVGIACRVTNFFKRNRNKY